VTVFRLLHLLALLWLMTGVGAVIVPTWRAWATKDLEVRAVLLSEAQQNESRWLLPGVIGVVFTGFGWAAAENMNFFGTGWLLAKMIIYAIDIFIFLPHGRRAAPCALPCAAGAEAGRVDRGAP